MSKNRITPSERAEIKNEVSQSLTEIKIDSVIAKEYFKDGYYKLASVSLANLICKATAAMLNIATLRAARVLRLRKKRRDRKVTKLA
jgi:hypothetical protein